MNILLNHPFFMRSTNQTGARSDYLQRRRAIVMSLTVLFFWIPLVASAESGWICSTPEPPPQNELEKILRTGPPIEMKKLLISGHEISDVTLQSDGLKWTWEILINNDLGLVAVRASAEKSESDKYLNGSKKTSIQIDMISIDKKSGEYLELENSVESIDSSKTKRGSCVGF